MDAFARSKPEDRLAILREAAQRRDLTPVVMEKDFWVCWTLKRLAEHPELSPHLTFKGGTSLSKAYGIIERFSEDIDLTIGRSAPYVRDTEPPMEEGLSGKKREARIDALVEAAKRYVADIVVTALNDVIATALGTKDGWQVTLDEADPQTVLFHYPRTFEYGRYEGGAVMGDFMFGETMLGDVGEFVPGYIRPQIRLEFGARGEPDPHEERHFTPYIAETFPDIVTDALCTFPTLAAERTFWEKATILHALYHTGKIRDRLSRHYYDLHMLAEKGIADKAIAAPDLLAQVVRNKSLMFREPKASYETAVFGTLNLLPKNEGIAELKRDYAAMSEMFMGEIPPLDHVLASIATLELKINDKS